MSNNVGRTTDSGQASPLDDDKELEALLLTIFPVDIRLVSKVGGRFSQSDENTARVDANAKKRAEAKVKLTAWAAKQAEAARIDEIEMFMEYLRQRYELPNDEQHFDSYLVERLATLQQGEKHG